MIKKIFRFVIGLIFSILLCTSVAFANATYSQYVQSLGPVGYWRLNSPATGTGTKVVDLAASPHDGTIQFWSGSAATLNTDYSIGGTGPIAADNSLAWKNLTTSLTTPIASANIDLGASYPASNTTWSVAFWYNATITNEVGCFFTWGYRSLCISNGSGAVGTIFSFLNESTSTWYSLTSTVPTDGNWHFVVLNVTSNTTVDLWLDNVLIQSAVTIAGGTQGGTGTHFSNIGNRGFQSDPFRGSLSDVAFFNTNLTASQIDNLYSLSASVTEYSTAVTSLSPSAFWKLNETSGSVINDSSGNGYAGTYGSSLTLGGVPLFSNPGDLNNYSLLFPAGSGNSSAYWGQIPYSSVLEGSGSKKTLNFFYTFTGPTTSNDNLVADGYPAYSGGVYGYWNVLLVGAQVYLQINGGLLGLGSNTSLVAGQVYMITITFDSTSSAAAKIYINGHLDSSYGAYATAIPAGVDGWTFGNIYSATAATSQNMSYISYWNSVALTASQISGLYAVAQRTILRNSYSPAYVNYVMNPQYGINSAVVGYWRMDDSTGTIVRDYSGFGRDGTMRGTSGSQYFQGQTGAISYDTDYSTQFYYTASSGVLLPTTLPTSTNYSVAFWYNQNGNAAQASWYGEWNGVSFGIGNGTRTGAGTDLEFASDAASAYYATTYVMPVDGKWHFVVLNFTSGAVTAYVDNGLAVNGFAINSTFSGTNSGIGALQTAYSVNSNGQAPNANIDEVTFFNRNLTTSEITKLYGYGTLAIKGKNVNYPNSSLFDSYAAAGGNANAASVTNGTGSYSAGTSYSLTNTSAYTNSAILTAFTIPTSTNTFNIQLHNNGTNADSIVMSAGQMCPKMTSTTGTCATFTYTGQAILWAWANNATSSIGGVLFSVNSSGAYGSIIATVSMTNSGVYISTGNMVLNPTGAAEVLGGSGISLNLGFPTQLFNYGTNGPPLFPPGYFLPIGATVDYLNNTNNLSEVCSGGASVFSAATVNTLGTITLNGGLTNGCMGWTGTSGYQNIAASFRFNANSASLSANTFYIYPKFSSTSNDQYIAINSSGALCMNSLTSPCSTSTISNSTWYDIEVYYQALTTTTGNFGIQACPETSIGVANYNACITMRAFSATGTGTPGILNYFALQNSYGTGTSGSMLIGGAYPFMNIRNYGSNSMVPITLSQFQRGIGY